MTQRSISDGLAVRPAASGAAWSAMTAPDGLPKDQPDDLAARLPLFAFERSSDHVIITDAGSNAAGEHRIVYVNPACLAATGYAREEVIGRSPRMFRGQDTDSAAARRIAAHLRRGENVREVIVNCTKSGAPYEAELNITPIRNEAGRIVYFCSVQRDVTTQAKANEARELERLLMARAEEIGAIGSWGYLVDEDRLVWSDGTYRIFGVDPGTELTSASAGLQYIAPRDRDALRAISATCIRQQVRQAHEISGIRQSGELINLAVIAEPIIGEDGRTRAIAGAVRDITAEKRMRNALSDSLLQQETVERHFASARKAAKIGLFDYSIAHDLIYWSDELYAMTGLKPNSSPAPSADFNARIDPEDRPEFDARFARALEHGEGFIMTVRFHRPDRRIVRIEIIAEVRETHAGRRLVGIARDVTVEVGAAEQLIRQEERFRIIADTLSDVLWDFDCESETFWVTPHWPRKLSLSVSEDAFDPVNWSASIIAEDRPAAEASLAEAIMTGSMRWHCGFRVREPDGRIEHIELKAAILRREEGGVHRILGNARNVTLEKQALEGSSRSRALEAVGQMTGGVAHDFNNLLMIIQGNAELLSLSTLDEDDQESVDLISKASRSAAELTNRLLAFSGQTRLNTARINVREAIADLGPLLKSGLTESVRLVTRVRADVWDIEVDRSELERAIINLAVNARDALPDGGTVEVCCENRVLAKGRESADLGIKPGRYVCISVIDDGCGMSEDVLARAIDPFFTTKEFGRGTGLGLSSVYGFAQQSGGAITIESAPGHGTRVSIFLPVSKRLIARRAQPAAAVDALVPQGARVLVVEDQEDVRAHVHKLLTRAGFAVECAPDARAALELLRAGMRFDLLFTDIMMPGGINGVELCERARTLAPGMPVLFTSGFPSGVPDQLKTADHGKAQLLKKPYRGSELVALVSQLVRAG